MQLTVYAIEPLPLREFVLVTVVWEDVAGEPSAEAFLFNRSDTQGAICGQRVHRPPARGNVPPELVALIDVHDQVLMWAKGTLEAILLQAHEKQGAAAPFPDPPHFIQRPRNDLLREWVFRTRNVPLEEIAYRSRCAEFTRELRAISEMPRLRAEEV